MERQKARWAAQRIRRIIGQSVRDTFGGEQFRNRFGAAFVPDLFEPAANQDFVL
jgi:hypothetical protein